MKYKTRFLFFFAAMILFNMASNFAHPVTPTIIQNLSLPDYMFGLMLACTQFTNFLFSPFWGKMNVSISSRRTLLICCVGYGAAELGFACATTQAIILLVRILAGFFVGGIFVSFLTYVINVAHPDDQAKFLTYSATITAVAGAFGYLVGGVLGEFSIRGAFFLQAFCLCLAGVVFWLVCLPDGNQERVDLKRISREANPLKAFADGKYFMNWAFALLFAVNLLMNFANTGFDQVFNYYLKDQLGLTSSYNGIIKAAVGLISFAFNMTLCLWIIRKTNIKVSMAVLMGLCALAALGTIFAAEIWLFISLGVFVYAGYSVSLPVLQHMVAVQADPARKNLVMGFYNAIKSLGSVVGSLMAGFLYAVHIKLPFAVVAVAYGLSCLAAIGYLMKKEK